MADAITKVSDVIVPEIFVPYVIERTATKSELVQAGIIEADSQFDTLAAGAGSTVNMPFWQDLQGNSQVLSENAGLETAKITASRDVAVLNNRGQGWATSDLSKLLSGDDPMMAIGNLVGDWWARDMQTTSLSFLKGIFATAGMAGNKLAIHATSGSPGVTNYFTGSTFIDAAQKLGDAKDKLSAVILHSAVEASLLKQDLIDFVPDSEGKPTVKVFQGKRVIVDDTMPVRTVNSALVYTSYVFGRGAIAMGTRPNTNEAVEGGHGTWEVEFNRKAANGVSEMFNRRRFLLHLRGVKWLGASMAGLSPTNTEFENAANWLRVYEAKNLRVVQFEHNIAA